MLQDEMRHRETSRENRRTDRKDKLKKWKNRKTNVGVEQFCVPLCRAEVSKERKREEERERKIKRDKEG